MKMYALARTDGGVEIMQCIPRGDGSYPSPDECLAKWHPDRRAAITSVAVIDPASVPADRAFRDAWKPDLTIHMPKAREIWKDKMRATRAPKLQALDVQYTRATETGDKAAMGAVVMQKQALRDVTADPAIKAAKTPEDLKAIWPDILK